MTTDRNRMNIDPLDLLRLLARQIQVNDPDNSLAYRTIYNVIAECERLRQVEIAALELVDQILVEGINIELPTEESIIVQTIRGTHWPSF